MRAYVSDFNGILTEVKKRVQTVSDPRDADIIILWQDVRSHMKTLCDINKERMGKPVLVVQHGRGATRDYLPPNSFPLVADKICVWGESEAERLAMAGYDESRVAITGSPLTFYTRNPKPRDPQAVGKKVITFTPVITSHEEVENIEVALELRKIEYTIVQETLRANKSGLRNFWHSWVINPEVATENQIPYKILHPGWNVVHKLTDAHDSQLYHGEQIKTSVTHAKHIENSIITLSSTDCVVGLEEGTFQLMATAMGIPTVIVDGFEYGDYGGVTDYKTDKIRTEATSFCSIKDLRQTIEQELNHPELRQDAREAVIRREFDPYPDKDPIELIIDEACKLVNADIRTHQLETI